MTKCKAWYIKFPTDAYALGPLRFKEPVAEKEIRAEARRFDGCTRLPNGFQCWPTSD